MIGLSRADFESLYTDEAAAVFKAYSEARQADERAQWERMRLQATISVQPYTKQKITPQKLLPFPWEQRNNPRKVTAPRLTPEEHKARREALLKRLSGDVPTLTGVKVGQ